MFYINTRYPEYLLAIKKFGTLSAAAQSMNVSQPTLTNFLKHTEHKLGNPLFERRHQVMIPTEAGRIYLEACQKIVDIKARTYSSILSLEKEPEDYIRIGTTPHRGVELFSKVFPLFNRAYPAVQVIQHEGYSVELLDKLERGELDFCLGTSSVENPSRFVFYQFLVEELFLTVPISHPLAALSSSGDVRSSTHIRAFEDTPFVLWDDHTTNSLIVNNYLESANIVPTVVYKSNNAKLIDSMLENGAGIGFLPDSYCRPSTSRVYFSLEPRLFSHVGTFCNKNKPLSDPQRYFLYTMARSSYLSGLGDVNQSNAATLKIVEEFGEYNDGHTTA